jgi:hypothetical protein
MPEDQQPLAGAPRSDAETGEWVDRPCARCCFWRPGLVVLRGNTQGSCKQGLGTTSADFSCTDWEDDE